MRQRRRARRAGGVRGACAWLLAGSLLGAWGTCGGVPLAPRAVFCTRGGLFTSLVVHEDASSVDADARTLQLDVCCTTTPYIEGLGEAQAQCAQLGHASTKTQPADAWGGGVACQPGHVVTDVSSTAVPGLPKLLSLHVECGRLSPSLRSAVDHLSVVFTTTAIMRLSAFHRELPTAHMPTPSPGRPAAVVEAVNLLDEVPLCGSSGDGDLRVAHADVQCLGTPRDVCYCSAGALVCSLAGSLEMRTLPHMLLQEDARWMFGQDTAPWCKDDDVAAGWMLLQDADGRSCVSVDPGASSLAQVPCDAQDLRQHWRWASNSTDDSRLEAAQMPGWCAILQQPKHGDHGLDGLELRSCLQEDLLTATATGSHKATALPEGGWSLPGGIKAALLPEASGSWRTDEATVHNTFAALGRTPPAAAVFQPHAAASEALLGRTRQALPHCQLPGAFCNAMGRVVQLNLGEPPQGGLGRPRPEAITRTALELPFLAALSLRGAPANGSLPSAASLLHVPRHLRSLDVAGTQLHGVLPEDWHALRDLAFLNVSRSQLAGPVPLTWLHPPPALQARRVPIMVAAGGAGGQPGLCLPYAPQADTMPAAVILGAAGPQGATPVCDRYTRWTVKLRDGLACELAAVCGRHDAAPRGGEQRRANMQSFMTQLAGDSASSAALVSLTCTAVCSAADSPVTAPPQAGPGAPSRRLAAQSLRPLQRGLRRAAARRLMADGAGSGGGGARIHFVTVGVHGKAALGRNLFATAFSDVLSTGDSSQAQVTFVSAEDFAEAAVEAGGRDVGVTAVEPSQRNGGSGQRVAVLPVVVLTCTAACMLLGVALGLTAWHSRRVQRGAGGAKVVVPAAAKGGAGVERGGRRTPRVYRAQCPEMLHPDFHPWGYRCATLHEVPSQEVSEDPEAATQATGTEVTDVSLPAAPSSTMHTAPDSAPYAVNTASFAETLYATAPAAPASTPLEAALMDSLTGNPLMSTAASSAVSVDIHLLPLPGIMAAEDGIEQRRPCLCATSHPRVLSQDSCVAHPAEQSAAGPPPIIASTLDTLSMPSSFASVPSGAGGGTGAEELLPKQEAKMDEQRDLKDSPGVPVLRTMDGLVSLGGNSENLSGSVGSPVFLLNWPEQCHVPQRTMSASQPVDGTGESERLLPQRPLPSTLGHVGREHALRQQAWQHVPTGMDASKTAQ